MSGTIAADEQQITTLDANLTATTAKLNQVNAQVTTLNAQIVTDSSEISALTTGYAKANGTASAQASEITLLQTQVSSLESQVAALNSKAEVLQSQITTLNAQVSTLQSQVKELTSALNLGFETNLVASTTVTIPPENSTSPGLAVVSTFGAPDAGYIVVNMTATSDVNNVGVVVLMVYSSSVHSPKYTGAYLHFFFTTPPDSWVIPVTPGTVILFCSNYDSTSQSETISAAFYY
jgi:outer membrane murein-binding lipoprotein Lpp